MLATSFRTLGIKEAASLLMVHPVTLYQMAEKGEIPAAKPGKKWVFIDVDLIQWLRSQYTMQASVSDSSERRNTCHFTNEKAPKSGGVNLQTPQENEYRRALGLK
jgi:excisionase family DNA binding protein